MSGYWVGGFVGLSCWMLLQTLLAIILQGETREVTKGNIVSAVTLAFVFATFALLTEVLA